MKQLLLVSYYFPPSGGPGVQRALKFARYLPEFGWQPTVLTVAPEAAAYPNRDPSLLDEVPAAVHVERTGAWDPYALYARLLGKRKEETVSVGFLGEAHPGWKQRLARFLRANLFLPDARVGWVPYALKAGRRLLGEHHFDAVLTTGPPHSAHLVGWGLARPRRLPWVADFRDPWTDIDFADELPTTRLAQRLDAALERAVLRQASLVTVVTPAWLADLERRVPSRYALLRNGFDPADFAPTDVDVPGAAGEDLFRITYVGNLNKDRSPTPLFEALVALDATRRLPQLRIRLVGNVDPLVVEEAHRLGLGGLLEQRPYVPHGEAVREMRAAALLLLVVNRVGNQRGVVPGKVYEYLASGRPTLGIGPPEGDAADVVRAGEGGRFFDYRDAAGVGAFVQRHYEAWAAGHPLPGAPTDRAAPFSRRRQSARLAMLLDQLLEASS